MPPPPQQSQPLGGILIPEASLKILILNLDRGSSVLGCKTFEKTVQEVNLPGLLFLCVDAPLDKTLRGTELRWGDFWPSLHLDPDKIVEKKKITC